MVATTTRGTGAVGRTSYNGYTASRPAVFGLAKIFCLGLSQLSLAGAAPLKTLLHAYEDDDEPDAEDASLWLYLVIAMVLVLLGGAFAGLTIALMGQDGIYLQVIATSGEGKEQKHAQSVYRLLKRGKHWVLVTLLLSNVIVNETLPIVLDRSLGGGWPAVLGSTVLIVIFGEVIPQSVCVRYGLQIGSFMANPVLCLMYILAPIAWPTAKLLDWLLGEDHGTVYKKSGLKTLVTLHKTLGTSPGDRLNQDEVTIISAVLDLKDKPVGDIMTPMEDVFTMSADTILDEKTMDIILSAGYSRIPIFEPGNENNFVGMLLVKILITYDPEDGKKVSEFALATLPETRPETSCLDIVNFFQEGKSHMVLVSEYPGENYGATGVVTLEDVIEELIGEEIIDESDVFIDVHKAIRRMAPAPKAQRAPKGAIVHDPDGPVINEDTLLETQDDLIQYEETQRNKLDQIASKASTPANFGSSPKTTFLRRSSSAADGRATTPVPVRGNTMDMREHLKHLGPSNLASRPKSTRYNAVKIKPGHTTMPSDSNARPPSVVEEPYRDIPASGGGEGAGLLRSAGREASDGVQAVQQGYGSMDRTSNFSKTLEANKAAAHETPDSPLGQSDRNISPLRPSVRRGPSSNSQRSSDTLGSLRSRSDSPPRKRGIARSGSITENIVDTGGVRKVVLETTSSSDDIDKDGAHPSGKHSSHNQSSQSLLSTQENDKPKTSTHNGDGHGEEVKKKRKRRNKKKGAMKGEDSVVASSSTQH